MGDEVVKTAKEESMPRPSMEGKAYIADFLSFMEMVSLRELNIANDNVRINRSQQVTGQAAYCSNKVSAIRWLINVNKQRKAYDENS